MLHPLFWKLPHRWQLRYLRFLVWWCAHTPHEHCWMGSESWSSASGFVRHGDSCAICGKTRPGSS